MGLIVMSMYFQVDEMALDDWRIRRLAKELGATYERAFLLLCRVWCQLYKRGGGLMPTLEIDAVSDCEGLANAMVSAGLAELLPGGIRIRGEERADRFARYRLVQKAKSDKGHEARYGNGENNDVPPGMPAGMPPGCPEACPDSSSSLSLFPDLIPDSGSGESTPRARMAVQRATALEATESWVEWFNERFTRAFTVSQALTKQIGALLAQGYSEKPDMRGVALYMQGLWGGDEKMAQFLVPSSILRAGKFQERLDAARESHPSNWRPEVVVADIPPEPDVVMAVVPPAPRPEYMDRSEIAQVALGLARQLGGRR